MKEFTYAITISGGIHARPASALYAFIRTCDSTVMISKNGRTINARRLTDIIELHIRQHDIISFQVEGEYEKKDCDALQMYCKTHL